MKYDVFISYSRKDLVVADKICDVLDKAGVSYFIDRQGIGGGMEFPKVIATAIKESELFLFLASENSYSSKFTTSEITFAFNKKQKNQLLPYVIDLSPLPDELEFVFSCINIRNIKEHPIETTLVEDILDLLGRNKVNDPLCPCGSGKLFKDCHGRTVAPTPKPVENAWKVGDYYTHGEEEGIVFWVDETGRYGKVVSVDEQMLPWCTEEEYESGLSLISFSDSNGMLNLQSIMQIPDWRNKYPAFAWCADHGENWYLPAIDELKELLLNDDVREKINGMLEQKGKSTMCRQPVWDSIVLNEPFDGGVDGYWSSTINGRWQAHIVDTLFFRMGESQRTFCFAVRAVSTFDERWLLSFEI